VTVAVQAPAATAVPAISLRGATKRFDDYTAIEDLNLDITAGTFVAVVGPSGCGKSTMLSLIAGLEAPSAGEVLVRGARVDGIPSRIGFMFQRDALLPWKTVRDNIAFPLQLRSFSKERVQREVIEWTARVHLRGFEDRYPSQLSGGMRKRASLAQTLVYDPEIILMDEPFSALDVQTRDLMEDELLQLWQGTGKTIVFVTHDLEEAIALADRVVVMTSGPARIKAVYDVPLSRPRRIHEVRMEPEFTALYRAMWNDLRDEVLRSYERQKQA
jgi:NitT/TauT family transport system ATP-binding protein